MAAVISLNAGSSSIKFALFRIEGGRLHRSMTGKIEGIGTDPRLLIRDADGAAVAEHRWEGRGDLGHEALLGHWFDWAAGALGKAEVIGVGHRVVHGGSSHVSPVLVDEAVLATLDRLCALAPLHQPHNLAAIRAVAALAPDLAQVACFDTAFHAGQPMLATRLAIPRALHDQGIRRYGFHGLSYDHVARALRQVDPGLAAGRVVVAHLGNGASLCAMHDGRSVDTTMGFTALDGLMMGTRCGTIDPGVVLHLQMREGMRASDVEDLLYRQSGLLGVSGISSDMRALHASDDPAAVEAIDLFVRRVVREAGAMIAALEGMDGIVFTAGIGENDPVVRAAVCARLGWIGLVLDPAANAANAPVISAPESRVVVRVIPTDEERRIAEQTIFLLEAERNA